MPEYTIARTLKCALDKLEGCFDFGLDADMLRYTPGDVKGDIAFPCFSAAKKLKRNPVEVASEVVARISFSENELIEKSEADSGYINFSINYPDFCDGVMDDYRKYGENYGSNALGEGRTIVIDYSSPNIAKPFSIGHLRSTNIGAALCALLTFSGYRVIGDNHIGDWGTQFGKLIYAYKRWGNREEIEKSPIREFLKLYVRFHEEAGEHSDEDEESSAPMEDEARKYFKLLESGDPEVTALWKWIRALSLEEFQKVYLRLGIEFDEVLGEYFYNDKMADIQKLAEEKSLTEQDKDGTLLIRLDEYGISAPLLIRKKDGTSLYATRDLACVAFRENKWKPYKILYVVGDEQSLYFKQIFKVKELLGLETDCEHIQFGLMVLPEGKISTRKGNVIFLEDVLNEACERVLHIIRDRDLSEDKKREIAEVVGVGAVKYHDLSQNRKKSVVFDWDKMLALEGNSSPYLQYSYSRARSILRKANIEKELQWHKHVDMEPEELSLIKKLARFPEAVEAASTQFYPHIIATYLFELAQEYSAFYTKVKVLGEPSDVMENRLLMNEFYASVIKKGLALLGIGVVEEM